MASVSELMTRHVPRASTNERVGMVLDRLQELQPEEAGHVYLIDVHSILIGQLPIERLVASPRETLLDDCVAYRPSRFLQTRTQRWNPALASGPEATVFQDLLSVATYLRIASLFF